MQSRIDDTFAHFVCCTLAFIIGCQAVDLVECDDSNLRIDGHHGCVEVVSWWCLGCVSVVFRLCLGYASVSLGGILLVFRLSLGVILAQSWWCLGCVLVVSWLCRGYV